MDLLYHHAKYGGETGDRGSRAVCRRKSVMFFLFCLFFVTLWNDEVCDNGNAMKQYNFQNNYGVIIIIIKNECHSNIIVDRLQGCGHCKKLRDSESESRSSKVV